MDEEFSLDNSPENEVSQPVLDGNLVEPSSDIQLFNQGSAAQFEGTEDAEDGGQDDPESTVKYGYWPMVTPTNPCKICKAESRCRCARNGNMHACMTRESDVWLPRGGWLHVSNQPERLLQGRFDPYALMPTGEPDMYNLNPLGPECDRLIPEPVCKGFGDFYYNPTLGRPEQTLPPCRNYTRCSYCGPYLWSRLLNYLAFVISYHDTIYFRFLEPDDSGRRKDALRKQATRQASQYLCFEGAFRMLCIAEQPLHRKGWAEISSQEALWIIEVYGDIDCNSCTISSSENGPWRPPPYSKSAKAVDDRIYLGRRKAHADTQSLKAATLHFRVKDPRDLPVLVSRPDLLAFYQDWALKQPDYTIQNKEPKRGRKGKGEEF